MGFFGCVSWKGGGEVGIVCERKKVRSASIIFAVTTNKTGTYFRFPERARLNLGV